MSSKYLNIKTNQYPLSEQDIRDLYPNVSFTSVFSPPDDFIEVEETPMPQHDTLTYYIKELPPKNIDGKFVQQFDVIKYTDQEIIENKMAIINEYDKYLMRYYDSVANQKNYDNRITCSLRAGYPGPFQADGLAFAQWMDNCNVIAYTIMQEVINNKRNIPSHDDFINELPAIVWPE